MLLSESPRGSIETQLLHILVVSADIITLKINHIAVITRLHVWGSGVRILVEKDGLFSSLNIQTDSEVHTASCSMSTGMFPRRKAVGAW